MMRAMQMKRKRDKEEADAAMTIGYAALQCGRESVANIIETLLDVASESDLRAALFLVMQQQKIRVPSHFAKESQQVIAAVDKRAGRQRASIAAARAEREAYSEFKRARQAENLVKDPQPTLPTEDKP